LEITVGCLHDATTSQDRFDPFRFALPASLVFLVQKVLKRTLFKIWADCAVHVVVLTLLVCVAGNGWAETGVVDSSCPADDLSAAEYLRLNADEQSEKLEEYRQQYRAAMNTVVRRLRMLFAGKPVTIQFRLKTVESMREKLIRKGYRCLAQMTDIAGVRVLILNYAAIPFVSQTVQEHFVVREKENLVDDPRGTGYRAIHYLLSAAGRIVELQIHTIRGNLWALMSYFLIYKGPYRANEPVEKYFEALSRTLYLMDSGFGRRELPLPTSLPLSVQDEIQGGLMLIQAFDDEGACPDIGATLESIQKSGLLHEESDYYGMDEFDLSFRHVDFAEPRPN
jgi:ppGpp synthetase/RelA/SpoT-type nucleotidyltranferase